MESKSIDAYTHKHIHYIENRKPKKADCHFAKWPSSNWFMELIDSLGARMYQVLRSRG